MKKITLAYFVLLLAVGLYSCKKIITVNLNDAPPKMVIEGSVTNEPGRYVIKISKTVGYTSDNFFPNVSGAIVKITDSTTGLTDILTETNSGTYKTLTLQGIQGHTYQLYVLTEGKEYRASSTMPTPINLDSVTYQNNIAFGTNTINALPNFQDPLGVNNYYQFIQNINSKQSRQIFVFDDRLSDGKYISRQLFNDSSYIQPKDTIQIEMRCIDKKVFDYLKQLSGLDPTNGQPTTPANPTSNISGGSLGYFSAHTVQRKKTIVK